MSTQSKTFSCKFPKCLKTYSNKFNLQRHIELKHGKPKRFRCRQCGKYLSSKQNLKEHQNIHSQISPYQCKEPNCGMTFRQTSQYSNHKKLHREVLLMSLNLVEPQCLKLTDFFKDTRNESLIESTSIVLKNIQLPNISKPQFSVTLPRLPLHFCDESGGLFEKTDEMI